MMLPTQPNPADPNMPPKPIVVMSIDELANLLSTHHKPAVHIGDYIRMPCYEASSCHAQDRIQQFKGIELVKDLNNPIMLYFKFDCKYCNTERKYGLIRLGWMYDGRTNTFKRQSEK